ncbi:MAG: glycoside hydrolase family 130 protein [Spirochaetia bacterium]|jgi:predicted GH43/DUF377 family glycosyl hydrolase|nr:glycoside hydrolase family 130 protein [Spirochaetia bacterium]
MDFLPGAHMDSTVLHRYEGNPVISIDDVKPTAEGMQVVGIFNCGGVLRNGRVYLVCRTAERMISQEEDKLIVPFWDRNGFSSLSFDRDDSHLDLSDSRLVRDRRSGKVVALTSFSSFRLAISDDGYHFQVADTPCILPDPVTEAWGMEDPRVTELEGKYYLTYSSVSRDGVGVSLAVTDDFKTYASLGMILPPTNKDTVLFPERIDGRYYLLHRPSPSGDIGSSDIWLADSVDLVHWGNHRHLCSSREGNSWEWGKIGAGTPPIHIPEGWLLLYHGVDMQERYAMGALLLDGKDPSVILSRSVKPVMLPEMPYEKSGFFSETVFPCTAILSGDKVIVFYGAADNSICRVDITLDGLLV